MIFFYITHEFSEHTCCCMFPKTELWLKHFIYFRVSIYIRLSSLSYIMDMLNRTKRHVQNRDTPEAQSGRLIIMLHELRVPVACTCIDCNCYSADVQSHLSSGRHQKQCCALTDLDEHGPRAGLAFTAMAACL